MDGAGKTEMNRCALEKCFPNWMILEKSALFLIRTVFFNRHMGRTPGALFIADRQPFASFGPPALQHRSAGFACHTRAKAVFVHSFPFTGLKCSLH